MDRSPQGVRRGAAAVTSSDPALHTLSYLHTREFDTPRHQTEVDGAFGLSAGQGSDAGIPTRGWGY